jgi:peptide/nickel transport system substrate-binding protein
LKKYSFTKCFFPTAFLKRTERLLFFCFCFLLCPGLSRAAVPAPTEKHGGTLVLPTVSDPKSFNDIVAKETSSTLITSLIFEGLTKTNAFTLQVEPFLARDWDVSEDGLTWTFYLREDVVWNDGYPFTADDVVFTFKDLIYNDAVPTSSRDIFTINDEQFDVTKIDDYTVQFRLPVKFAPFLRAMGQAILPKHRLLQSVKDGTFSFTWGIDTPPEDIVGTGPFKLAQYRPGERLVLRRNERYWQKSAEGDALPYLDRVIFLIVQNQDVEILKFFDGEIDYCLISRGNDYPLLKPLEAEKNFTIYEAGPNFGTNFLLFNQNRDRNPDTGAPFVDPVKLSWFTNRDFRRAVAHAIDRAQMIDILKNQLGYPQDGALSPSAGFFYNPDVVQYDYNLQKAKDLLASNGFIDRGGDGVLEDPSGNPVQFNLFTNSNNAERVQIAAIIRHDLQSLGMRVNFLALEFNSLVSKLNATYDWDAIILGLTGGVEPHFGKNVWDSGGQLHMWYPKQKAPATDWEKRIDEIFTAGVQELDDNKRKVLYDEWQEIVAEELPFIYTVLGSNIFAVRNKFGNLKPSSYAGPFHNVEEIYVLKEYR